MDHALGIVPARCHGLLRHDVPPGSRDLYRLIGMQATRRRDSDDVGFGACKKGCEIRVGFCAGAGHRRLQRVAIDIAYTNQLDFAFMGSNRTKVIVGNAPATDEPKTDFSTGNRWLVLDHLFVSRLIRRTHRSDPLFDR